MTTEHEATRPETTICSIWAVLDRRRPDTSPLATVRHRSRRLALHAAHVLRNARSDLAYGRPLASRDNSDYLALDRILGGRLSADDVLVDLGSGRGRVINWWVDRAQPGRIVGVEADPAKARSAARRHQHHPAVAVREGDMTTVALPADATVVYLFNPGGRTLIDAVQARLLALESLREVAYYNPKHLEAFGSDEWRVERIRLSDDNHRPFSDLARLWPRRNDG